MTGFRLRRQAAVAGCLGIFRADLLVEPTLPRAVHDHGDVQPAPAMAVIAGQPWAVLEPGDRPVGHPGLPGDLQKIGRREATLRRTERGDRLASRPYSDAHPG